MRKKLFILSTIIALLLIVSNPLLAEMRGGTYEFGVYVGPSIGIDDANGFELNTGVLPGFRLGYNYTPYVGIETSFGWSTANMDIVGVEHEDQQFLFSADLILHLAPKHCLVPFLAVGVGLIDFRGDYMRDLYESADISKTRVSPNWGGGVKIFLSKNLAIRTDVRFYNFGLGFEGAGRMITLEVNSGLSYLY